MGNELIYCISRKNIYAKLLILKQPYMYIEIIISIKYIQTIQTNMGLT